MPDIVDIATRSRMMAGIRAKNTKPELLVRRGLHAMGFRYKLHEKGLPGRPDLVLPKHRVVIFVHGCFWHRHECGSFRWPQSRRNFWRTKLDGNADRDIRHLKALAALGWRCAVVWECQLKPQSLSDIIAGLSDWIRNQGPSNSQLPVFPEPQLYASAGLHRMPEER